MTEWRVDYRTGCGHWLPVGWWGIKRLALTFLRDLANPALTFRVVPC